MTRTTTPTVSPPDSAQPCPCGRTLGKGAHPLAYAQCCGRFHAGAEPAPDAETLMRSRYSAYVLGLTAYLQDTWHASTRPDNLALEPGVKWLGLDVRGHRMTNASHAEVEFVARSRLAGRGQRLHERSRFVNEGGPGQGRWYYVDGDLL
jgi:SEC-C motif domain protein